MEKKQAYALARKRLAHKMIFMLHLAIYVAVSMVLVFINFETSADYLWFKWPMLGWGIGVLFHALAVFFISGYSDMRMKLLDREAKKIMDAHDQARDNNDD